MDKVIMPHLYPDNLWCPVYSIFEKKLVPINPPITENYFLQQSTYSDISKQIKNDPATFCFYTFHKKNDKHSNLDLLIQCYFGVFNQEENVCLLISTDDPNLKNKINNIKDKFFSKNKKLPDIKVVTNILNEKDYFSIHKSCQCYVGLNGSVNWGWAAVDALTFRNQAVLCGGTFNNSEFHRNGIFLQYEYDLLGGENDEARFFDIPSEKVGISETLYEVFTKNYKKKSSMQEEFKNFSYTEIGKQIKACLEL